MTGKFAQDRHGHFAHILDERSRIREILLLVPAVAFLINLVSGHVAQLPWQAQGIVGGIALIIATVVIVRSPLFSLSGRFEAYIPVIFDSNKDRFAVPQSPVDAIGDPGSFRSLSWTLHNKAQKLEEQGHRTALEGEGHPDDVPKSFVSDAAFYWLIDTLAKDFRNSWGRVTVVPAGSGYEMRQESLPGKTVRLAHVPGFATFAEQHPRFKEGALALSDKELYVPLNASFVKFGGPKGNLLSVALKYGGAELQVATESRGWSTGMPPDVARQTIVLAQQGKVDDVMEIQRYYASVVRISTYFQVSYKISSLSALGPSFASQLAWIDAVVESIRRACEPEATYLGME